MKPPRKYKKQLEESIISNDSKVKNSEEAERADYQEYKVYHPMADLPEFGASKTGIIKLANNYSK